MVFSDPLVQRSSIWGCTMSMVASTVCNCGWNCGCKKCKDPTENKDKYCDSTTQCMHSA